MNKKILFFICLIIFTVSVATVSATDDVSQINTSDNNNLDNMGDILSISSSENEILGADVGTFTQLQEIINGTEAGSNITLNKNYEYDNGFSLDGIIIDKPLTINGNGNVLYAKNLSRIFQITATGNVNLNNITFKNGLHSTLNGGAIYIANTFTNSTFKNLKFIENTAYKNGGALYIKGASSEILFENVIFENNIAQLTDGGAINFNGNTRNITFNNVTFYKNTNKGKRGGAINFDNSIENCLFNNTFFINNFANISGGAISINTPTTMPDISALTFENTLFINNSAEKDGGAIIVGAWVRTNLNGTTFKNVTFTGNTAKDYGGALYVNGKTSSNIFEDVKFINNTAKTDNGGAIYFGSDINSNIGNTFKNVLFANNTAYYTGGALFMKGASSEILFENVTFENNIAQQTDGGAINFGDENFNRKMKDITFNNVTFYKNSANKGGAINIYDGSGIENCLFNNTFFINNTAKTDNGGAIYLGGDVNLNTFENVLFVNNTAYKNGGALYIKGASSEILFENVTFENNIAQRGDSGAINFGGKMTNITFNNVTFYKNSAKRMGASSTHSMGGAINIDNGIENCLFNNTFFINNFAKNSAGALSINGIISALTFENTQFINNTAELEDGGAIHVGTWKRSNLVGSTFKNVTFADNTANNSGGALFVTGETSSNIFEDVKFINNTAKTADGGAIKLGADKNLNSVGNTFENVLFTNNTAYKNGGALYIRGSSSSNKFKNVNFINNTAKTADSGAINFYNKVENTTFDNVTFYKNTATKSMGGAINIDNGIEKLIFNNTFFIGNDAGRSAGALSINKQISTLTFENTQFINNTAELEDGGAIHIGTWIRSNLVESTFKNVTFADNTANNSGGALFVTGETSSNIFEDVKFINNSAKTADGGAIKLGAIENLTSVGNTFNNVVFINNTANKTAGALYINGEISSTAFEKTIFINNTGEDVVYIKKSGSDNVIRDSIFINNNNNKIVVESGTVQMTDDWFGNNATNYNEMPDVEISLDNWLFLNATANPNAIGINQTSTVTFKLYSYNKGSIEEYNVSKMNITLYLSSTLGTLNQTNVLLGDEILYNASESGNGSVTGKFETAYYTIILKNKIATEIIVKNDTLELELNDIVDSGATLNPADAGILNYTSNNESVAIVENGKIIAVDEGTATITVSFSGNDDYSAAKNKTIVVTVKDSFRNITAENVTKFFGGSEQLVIIVTNSKGIFVSGETVLININGVTYNRTTDKNGTVRLNINLPSGDYPVNISVGNTSAVSYVSVITTINGSDVESEFRNVTYSAYVLDSEGNFLENGTAVEFNINGQIYTGYVNGYGEAIVDLILNSGNYTITATNPVTGENRANNIIINAKNPTINVTAPSITFGENATVTVTLPADATGNVTIGNEVVPVVDGNANAVLTNLPVGNTTVPVTYSGDDKYNNASTTVNITVYPKSDVIIVAENVTKYYHGPERFVANIYDSELNPMVNKSVNITINGVTYTKITDSNGSVSIGINLGSGTYDVITTVDNATVKSSVTVLSTITGNDIIKYYRNATQYSVQVFDTTGKAVGAGKVVTFNVNGRFYNRTTDANGIATLNINLPQGEYVITAINPVTGEMQANNITVLPVVAAEDITMKYLDGTQFVATLVDGQGNPYKDQFVTFNVNGILYNRLTDSNGQAALNIRLPPGEYIITSSFNGCNIANKITVMGVL